MSDGVLCVKSTHDVQELSEVQLKTHQRQRIQDGIMSMHEATMEAIDHVRGCKLDLVEICSPWDSPLGACCEKLGGRVARLGIHNGYALALGVDSIVPWTFCENIVLVFATCHRLVFPGVLFRT